MSWFNRRGRGNSPDTPTPRSRNRADLGEDDTMDDSTSDVTESGEGFPNGGKERPHKKKRTDSPLRSPSPDANNANTSNANTSNAPSPGMGNNAALAENLTGGIGLRGKVEMKDMHNLSRIAQYFGLQNRDLLRDWMASKGFMPYYSKLYNLHIKPYKEECLSKNVQPQQGPDLSKTIDIIKENLEYGGEVNFADFELDYSRLEGHQHYAICLYRCTEYNFKNPLGNFQS